MAALRLRGTGVAAAVLFGAAAVVFALRVREYWFLTDDAFISFRYARNLLDGHGLVWNPGEAVEGYTNFLWVLLMAASLAIGIPPELSSNVLGVASGSALLVAVAIVSARRYGATSPFAWIAPIGLALSHSFAAWCTGGLATMFFTLVAFLACVSFQRERERRTTLPVVSSVLFAVASLTRPEGVLFAAVVGATFTLDVVRRVRPLRSIIVWALPLTLVVGGHFLWRHSYYGYWLPNTFYAKVAGAWWDQGLRYLALYLDAYKVHWFLPLLFMTVLRGDRTSRLFVAICAIYTVYCAYVGGDRFEFRFLVVVFPYLYLALADGLRELVRAFEGRRGRTVVAAGCAGVAIALLATTYRAAEHSVERENRSTVAALKGIATYARRAVEEGRFLRAHIDSGALPADVVIAMGGAGAVPYYTGWTTIDRRGLNDEHIAHAPVNKRKWVAHFRDATTGYLQHREVAVFVFSRRLVTRDDSALRKEQTHRGQKLRVRAIRLEDRYLVFATFVSDEELQRIFEGHEILEGV